MPRPEYGIWRREWSAARANGRSLIYEPGAAPPPVITVYLVRARDTRAPPAAPSAQSRFRWREVRPAATRSLRLRTPTEPSAARASDPPAPAAPRSPAMRRLWPQRARLLPGPDMPRVKPACVRRVSIGTYSPHDSPQSTAHHTAQRKLWKLKKTPWSCLHSSALELVFHAFGKRDGNDSVGDNLVFKKWALRFAFGG